MATLSKIAPCLWFDSEAEVAANFYCSVFPNSQIDAISRYGNEGSEVHKRPAGSAMLVSFTLDGETFHALNGGPLFTFSEAISFMVGCENQQEIDHYWEKLSEGGHPQVCGWLKDKFGLSWQVVPNNLQAMMTTPDAARREQVMKVVMAMKKPIIADLQRAFHGS